MTARRLLLVATILSSTIVAACSGSPTGVEDVASTMQDSVSARRDQIPWH